MELTHNVNNKTGMCFVLFIFNKINGGIFRETHAISQATASFCEKKYTYAPN